nr:reverse transcriptase domain-containing protein [Tanacetum cinerariifolium]
MNKVLALIAKAFKFNTIPTNNNQRSSLIPRNSQITQPDMNMSQDINMKMVDDNVRNQYGNGNVVTTLAEGNGINGIQSTQEKFKFMVAADAYEETKRVKVDLTLEDTLQQASTSGTQSDNAHVYDSDRSTEISYDKAYNDMQQKIKRLQAQLGDLKVTSNSAPSTRESKVVQTVNVIALRIFWTNPSKTSRQQANFELNGFSSTRVNNTTKTRRPNPRSNPNTDRIPSKYKSSCLSNNVEKIEENHRNSQIPKNQKYMSSECNNITLAIQNAKSKIICAMCKQCLVTANHDVCVLNYVNDMNSRADNQSGNVSKCENQKKHKANANKSKELGSKGSLTSSRLANLELVLGLKAIRRPRIDPTLLNNFNMATNGNGDDVPPGGGDLLIPDLRTMEESYHPTLNGRGGPIAPIAIQAMNSGLKNDMIQQHQSEWVTDDALRLYLIPHSLTHHATAWFDRLPRNSITTFEQMAKMFLKKYFSPSMVTKLRNEITNFHQRPDESLFEAWECYTLSIDCCPNHNMLPVTQIDTFYNGLTLRYRDTINDAAGGTFMKRSESSSCITSSFFDPEIVALKAEMAEINKNLMKPPLAKLGTYMLREPIIKVVILTNLKNYHNQNRNQGNNHGIPQGNYQGRNQFFQGASHGQNPPPAYQAPGYQAPVQQAPIPQPQVVTTTKFTNYMKVNDTVLKNMQTNMTSFTNSKPVGAPVFEPVSAPKPNPKPSIPYPSRLHDQKLRDKTNDQKEKIFKIFQYLGFNISFADALILMPKFGPTVKILLTNKEKQFELARTLLNEHCSAVLLKKLPENLREPDKFLIPCDFLGMDECLALADLGASINVMPLSVWNKLSLPELYPTCMTLKLANRSISRPVRVVEDVFIKVGTFHFPADFVVVDFDVDPRVPLIIGRSFLKTEHALIDVYEGELTLRVGKKAVTFNLDQTSRYSTNYDAMSVNRIDLIDVACEEYSQEVLGFSVSGNLTPSTEPIVSNSSPTRTSFGDSNLLLEETDAFVAINDEPISPEINDCYYDSKRDILLLEEFLNDDPSSPPLPPRELKVVEPTNEKSSIDEPPVVELKDLPPHLEYAFLEGDDKLPIIIAKDLKDEEKTALIKVLKSHKQALAWKLSDIKGTFQRCMMAIFHDMIEKTMEVFMDDFSIFGNSFGTCLSHLDKMLKRCEDTNLCLNWEKSHFMVKEGIVLGHKILKNRIEVDKAKVDVIAKLPHPTTVKCLELPVISLVIATSGQVEVSNRGLKRILEMTVGENHASWSDKLDDALWAFRTTFKTPIRCTPYKLVYEKACHLPIELEHKAYWALKYCNYDLLIAGDHQKVQPNELNELRDQAYENSLIYKEKTKRIHDSKIKDCVFNVGDRVLLFNSRLKIFSGKLKTRWTGPFTITQVFPYGTIKLSQIDGPNFKVNGHRQHYFGEDIPKMVVLDL